MNKKVTIKTCDNCPYFNNYYYGYQETCELLDRKIKSEGDGFSGKHHIPVDCPLEDTDDGVLDSEKIMDHVSIKYLILGDNK